ncbi:hypothetical protein HPP92_010831 [Vanilla planifolia]|uniref:Homologous-pairing protein 2 homolog n=1 Tax=Vanilla planifolia TaxID=51239 RepID=A0A835RA82_VANPL|nr:hypothetical protein HPP92_011092 [Vanilla planifolia]KAG0482747.1 hypothetical protein HPP92_010831 [Vanilla planifolia]
MEKLIRILEDGIFDGLIKKQNRPLNSQNVADALQKYNLKKSAIQKGLDTLADSGQISFKEYGKQKIYLARQDQFKILNSQEIEQMKKANSQLQAEFDGQKKAIGELESEIRALQSNLTLEEIRSKQAILQAEVFGAEEKLKKLRDGVILVKPEDRMLTEQTFGDMMNHWRKRKRIFKDFWDVITENLPRDVKEFKEELGIEYDEDVGVSLQSYTELTNSSKKRRTAH